MVKQVIVVRKDLKMKSGKLASQVAHASMACILNCMQDAPVEDVYFPGNYTQEFWFSSEELEWITETPDSKFTKIVLRASSEEELLDIYNRAKESNINCSLIKDAGDTVFSEPTHTCIGLGPDKAELLDELTKDLKLY